MIPERDEKLQQETGRQQTNERLKVQFAQMANQVGQWIQQRTSRMTDIGMNARGTLENQLQELKSLNDEINNFKEHVVELDNINTVSLPCCIKRPIRKNIIFLNLMTIYNSFLCGLYKYIICCRRLQVCLLNLFRVYKKP